MSLKVHWYAVITFVFSLCNCDVVFISCSFFPYFNWRLLVFLFINTIKSRLPYQYELIHFSRHNMFVYLKFFANQY